MQAIFLGLSCFIVAIAICALTALKETPAFWLNSGGYPVGLRHFVLDFYYPLLGVYLLGLAVLTARGLILLFKVDPLRGAFLILALSPAWLLTAISMGLLVANNVKNLIKGLPLHAH